MIAHSSYLRYMSSSNYNSVICRHEKSSVEPFLLSEVIVLLNGLYWQLIIYQAEVSLSFILATENKK
jgi:hypothetical protein